VLSMIVFGAFAYFCMLRKLLNLSFFSAFVTGAMFGFCPWFVWKIGGHYNMIGSCFWGIALGAVLVAYAKNEFTAKNSALWAVFVWATFWTSLIEFFMLGIVVALTVVVFEFQRALLRDHAIVKRVLFFLPAALGAVSLLLFLFARKGQTVALPLMPGPTLLDLIPSAKLSLWSYIGLPNRTATVIPHSYVYLALIGGFALWRRQSRILWPIVALFIGAVALVIDPFHIPSSILRALPTGKGFRFFERFIPFALYFLLILSAVGLEFLYKEWVPKKPAWLLGAIRFPKKAVVIGGILVFAASELYPVLLNITPIMKLPITPEVRAELNPERYCLVVPDGDYRQVLQTYQVELDIPCVNIAYWDRMDKNALQRRAQEYPGVYAGAPAPHPQPTAPNVEAPSFPDEARALKIGYLLFENKNAAGTWRARGRTLLETDRELLLSIE
ncbi:MAG: hypothetical protein WC655_18180, partial [Candidatus Hydrogenedentales bacterium]